MLQYTEEARDVFLLRLYSPSTCKKILSRVNRFPAWERAQVRGGSDEGGYHSATVPEARSANVLSTVDGAKVYENFERKLDEVVKPLIKHIWRADFNEHAGTHLIHYPIGGHYKVHQDAGLDLSRRFFTVLCYLNDDFEGGHTQFPSLNYEAVPQCGKAIIFPSTYRHCSEPVRKGQKYVLISWLLGPMPIKWV